METHANTFNKPAGRPGTPGTPVCPQCLGRLNRVRRSVLDRLRGLFMRRGRALYRYRCHASACAWTGSLTRRVGGRNLYGAAGSRRHVLHAARMSGFGD